MKNVYVYAPNQIGAPFFAKEKSEDHPLYIWMNCAGNSSGSSPLAPLPLDTTFTKVHITASFVDTANFGLLLGPSYQPGDGNPAYAPIEYTVFANGPNGDSITLYLSVGTFVDGSTSLSIPCGKGKIISAITPGLSPIWGVIG